MLLANQEPPEQALPEPPEPLAQLALQELKEPPAPKAPKETQAPPPPLALPEQQARLDLRDHSLPPHLKRLSYQTVLNRARVRVTSSSG